MVEIVRKQPVIFCDFDGTITERDVIEMIMERFASPVWKDLVDQILNQRTLSIREGIQKLFQLLPVSLKPEIEAYVLEAVRLRNGFADFLTFCQSQQIPFLVVSGGVDFFIEPVLAPYRHQLQIFCNRASFQGETIAIETPYLLDTCPPCNQCACCKLGIMDRYPTSQYYRIAIGDSLTDLAMAKAADWTFARGRLISYAQEDNIPVTAYDSFVDIQTALNQALVIPAHG